MDILLWLEVLVKEICLKNGRVKATSEGIISEEEFKAIDNKIKAEIDAAVQFAEDSLYPDGESIFEDNYVQTDYPYMKD